MPSKGFIVPQLPLGSTVISLISRALFQCWFLFFIYVYMYVLPLCAWNWSDRCELLEMKPGSSVRAGSATVVLSVLAWCRFVCLFCIEASLKPWFFPSFQPQVLIWCILDDNKLVPKTPSPSVTGTSGRLAWSSRWSSCVNFMKELDYTREAPHLA